MIKILAQLNNNVNEVKDSVEDVLVTTSVEMCRQVMLSVRRRLRPSVQSGGRYFEHLCEVANLCSRQRDASCFFDGPLFALMLAAEVRCIIASRMIAAAI